MASKPRYIIGIDEAGRGPLAGPVAVGVAMVPVAFDWGLLPGVGDSKKVSPKNREAIFRRAAELFRSGRISFAVVMTSASRIDKVGIVPAIKQALEKALEKVVKIKPTLSPRDFYIKLDGGLKAPKEFQNQETIIKGDAKELVIGLASIVAKVTRDRYMEKLARETQYQAYDFGTHKGYGTKKHRESISLNGLSKEHRRSFCQRFIKLSLTK